MQTSKSSRSGRVRNGTKALGDAPEIELPTFALSLWDDDLDMVNLRMHFRKEMREAWNKGIIAFVAGDWSKATNQFKEVLTLTDGKDGPSKYLLSRMESHAYKVPVDWKGFTVL